MTPTEFDSLQLQAGNVIEVTFDNGTSNRYLLFQATATGEVPERTKYLTGEILPSIPSKIIVQDHETGADEGLALSAIRNIVKIR